VANYPQAAGLEPDMNITDTEALNFQAAGLEPDMNITDTEVLDLPAAGLVPDIGDCTFDAVRAMKLKVYKFRRTPTSRLSPLIAQTKPHYVASLPCIDMSPLLRPGMKKDVHGKRSLGTRLRR
jgi:hypothetical protein